MIKLRQFTIKDIDFILKNWSTTDRIDGCSFSNNAEQLIAIINEWATKIYQGKYFEQLAVLEYEDIVGMISLHEVSSNTVSFGIIIDKKYYKNSYATQSVNMIKDVARNKGYKQLVSTCRVDNFASIKLHEKCELINKGKSMSKKGNEIYSWYYDL